MCKKIFFLFSFIFLFIKAVYAQGDFVRVPIIKAYNGMLETHISGVTDSAPPYVRVMRSKEGLKYFFSSLNRIKNYQTVKKLHWLKQELLSVKLEKYMVVAIVSDPTDNYFMKYNGFYNLDNELLQVDLLYFHKEDISYQITPKKNIYYKILVVAKSSLPVILDVENGTLPTDEKEKKKPVKYISGKLFSNHNNELRLVSSATRKGLIYYLFGNAVSKLNKHIGKRVTLIGRVIDKHEGPYEANFEVTKVIKIYTKLK